MSGPPDNRSTGFVHVFWPASRRRALTRAVVWIAAAGLLGALTAAVYAQVDLGPGLVGSRLLHVSIAVGAVPIPVLCLFSLFKAIRWLLLTVWPRPVGIRATAESLTLELGPFGSRSFDASRIDVRYPFELSGDFEDGGFEAFLPEEHQLANFVPQLRHPDAREAIRDLILRFGAGTEAQAADALRPALERWRREPTGPT